MTYIIAVALGGAGGALLRYWLQYSLSTLMSFPIAILIANVLGSFLFGILFVLIEEKSLLAVWFKPLLMVGFLGAFTTFSSFSLDTIRLLESGQLASAVSNVLLNVTLAIGAAYAGILLARLFSH